MMHNVLGCCLFALVAITLSGCDDESSFSEKDIAEKAMVDHTSTRSSDGTVVFMDGPRMAMPDSLLIWIEGVIEESTTSLATPKSGRSAVPYMAISVPTGTYYMWGPGNTLVTSDGSVLLENRRFEMLIRLGDQLREARWNWKTSEVEKLLREEMSVK